MGGPMLRFTLLALLTAAVAFADNNCRVPIDPYKELLVVDPLVLEDARANPGGVWHFSSLLREMLPAGTTDAELSDFIVRWLGGSKAATKVNGFTLDFPGFALGERTICRWLNEAGRATCEAKA